MYHLLLKFELGNVASYTGNWNLCCVGKTGCCRIPLAKLVSEIAISRAAINITIVMKPFFDEFDKVKNSKG